MMFWLVILLIVTNFSWFAYTCHREASLTFEAYSERQLKEFWISRHSEVSDGWKDAEIRLNTARLAQKNSLLKLKRIRRYKRTK